MVAANVVDHDSALSLGKVRVSDTLRNYKRIVNHTMIIGKAERGICNEGIPRVMSMEWIGLKLGFI